MEVARRHGIAQSLLYRWRSDAAAAAARTAPAFLPVTIKGPPAATTRKTVTRPRASSSSLASVIEIDLVCGRTVRATADIDTVALARIVAALETKA